MKTNNSEINTMHHPVGRLLRLQQHNLVQMILIEVMPQTVGIILHLDRMVNQDLAPQHLRALRLGHHLLRLLGRGQIHRVQVHRLKVLLLGLLVLIRRLHPMLRITTDNHLPIR